MKITLVLLALAAIAVIFFIMKRKVVVIEKKEEVPKKSGVIYGSMTCPYTVKQTEKYPEYEYVDCKTSNCPEFVQAFPTTVHPDGKVVPGYVP
jgi:hypothetical protein